MPEKKFKVQGDKVVRGIKQFSSNFLYLTFDSMTGISLSVCCSFPDNLNNLRRSKDNGSSMMEKGADGALSPEKPANPGSKLDSEQIASNKPVHLHI
jgi:hypothetical protein